MTTQRTRAVLSVHCSSGLPLLMNRKDVLIAILFSAGYFAAAELGHTLSFPGRFASCWPPSGLYLAALLLVPTGRWKGIMVAALVGNLCSDIGFHGKSLPVSFGFWVANTAEAVTGAVVLLRAVGTPFMITRLRSAVWFLGAGVVVSTLVGAVIGASVVSISFGAPYGSAVVVWWMSSVMGMLLVTPPIVNLINARPWREPGVRQRMFEMAAVLGVLFTVGWYIFRLQAEPLAFATLPVIMWASIRLRVCGATFSSILIAGIAICNTASGYGPFAVYQSVTEQVVLTQGFLAVAAIISLTLAAMTMEQRDIRRQLEDLAALDSLTGLNNRRVFDRRLDEELSRYDRQGRALSLVILDIDHFKLFNDTYGHPAGDEVLKNVARQLLLAARNTDVVARIGGEEFAVLMPDTSRRDSLTAGERFRAAVSQVIWDNHRVTASIGVATVSSDCVLDASLVAHADMALYQAKKAGRNCVVHADAVNSVASKSQYTDWTSDAELLAVR